MAHTPGPWELAETGIDYAVISEAQYQPVAVALVYGSLSGDDIGDANDNAHLIAAAPDLLAACENALNWLASYPGFEGGGAEKAYNATRAAIAKALNT